MVSVYGFLSGTCFGLVLSVFIIYLAKLAMDPSGYYYQYLSIYGHLTNQTEILNHSAANIPSVIETQFANIHQGERELSSAISDSVRIVCWVMTQPKNHHTLAMTVRATWGKRCTKFYFVSSEPVTFPSDYNHSAEAWDLPPLITAVTNVKESKQILWNKTLTGFQYAYDHFFDEGDWFVKADDDTYMIVENLRYMLLDKDPSEPVHYGYAFKHFVETGFNSGGAGYVLSKEALKRFIERPPSAYCPDVGAEDISMGICLFSVGVVAGDSRDSEGKQRFIGLQPSAVVYPKVFTNFWIHFYVLYSASNHSIGVGCCSDKVVSFHYITDEWHWLLEYLIYHIHPFGVHPQLTGSNVKHQLLTYLAHKKASNITKSDNQLHVD